MAYELQGKVIEIYPTQQVSERFKKREFVVEKEENNGGNVFVDTIKFQTTQDRCGLLDQMQVGDMVKVTFNVRGNKWEKNGQINYFNNLDAWRIEKAQDSFDGVDAPMPSEEDFGSAPDEEGDLPF